MEKMKKGKRKPQRKTNNCFPSTLKLGELELNLNVEVVDIDGAGLVFRTYYPLEPGDILSFKAGIKIMEGIVKWSNKDIDNNYSVEVNFIDGALTCKS